MKYKTKTLLFIAALLAQMSYAGDEIVVRKGANTIAIKPDTAGTCRLTSIERYERYFLLQHQNDYYLISQSFEIGEGCFEGYNPAIVSLTAKKIDVQTGKSSKKKTWSFTTKGVSGERGKDSMDGVYIIQYPGCCGALDTFKYFSLYTGNLLGAAYLKPLVMKLPNMQKVRYIFLQDDNASEYIGKGGQITVFYSDIERLKQQLSITVANAPEPFYCQTSLKFSDKEDETYELWRKSDFDGVSVSIKIDCKTGQSIVEIPVISDSLSVDKAAIRGTLGIKIQKSP